MHNRGSLAPVQVITGGAAEQEWEARVVSAKDIFGLRTTLKFATERWFIVESYSRCFIWHPGFSVTILRSTYAVSLDKIDLERGLLQHYAAGTLRDSFRFPAKARTQPFTANYRRIPANDYDAQNTTRTENVICAGTTRKWNVRLVVPEHIASFGSR